MGNLKIAVIGKSSAGKSAFIRSFSSKPEYINSVGEGQTTRAYAEYVFIRDYNDDYPRVEAELATQSSFADTRVAQVFSDMKNDITDCDLGNIDWIKKQFVNDTYRKRIKRITLESRAFFHIKEFQFIDEDIVSWSDGEFEKLKAEILSYKEESDDKEKEGKREIAFEEILNKFFRDIYTRLLEQIRQNYEGNSMLTCDNNVYYFKFNVNDAEMQKLFSLLLKVDEDTQSSLTGMVSRVKVFSEINKKYAECLKGLNFKDISLIDTYGLDHSESIGKEMLRERYHRILNKNYPDVSIVFFVEALHAGASNDFKSAITMLYDVKPEIMAYVVATYIDENEDKLLSHKDWLFTEDKTSCEPPRLKGKVQLIIEEDDNLLATLLDHNISESMANRRREVMRSRFAPFCGDCRKAGNNIDYERVNITSIKMLFTSIAEKEHLGDGYIYIDKVLGGISENNILEEFAAQFLENAKRRFGEIYEMSANRTRWSIKKNIQNYILGFNGSTLDATWRRVFRDAFNETFTKEVLIGGRRQMLSDILGMEGNSKVAFDELIATIFPCLLRRKCTGEERLGFLVDEVNCRECAVGLKKRDDCIWNTFLNGASYEMFKSRDKYDRVIDWLWELHRFEQISIQEIANHLKITMTEQLVPMCRRHNMRMAGREIYKRTDAFWQAKREVYEKYVDEYDCGMEKEVFDRNVNTVLAKEN